jgi:hypothetical protein
MRGERDRERDKSAYVSIQASSREREASQHTGEFAKEKGKFARVRGESQHTGEFARGRGEFAARAVTERGEFMPPAAAASLRSPRPRRT